ncbi:MAG: MFS transporter [Bacteroidetes bacterium GWC2_33_15]|nr:MAG: MFS transporter [Bacteroidetes bacterium GWA2_33_15]OFX49101.1 MAG: MFS transporter [Bacteroidetes bacterium GWC2_33_15]OFX64869.1 MAG: MFS transporter [Bacteroidetes bacterium GWB2_32_14]OFX68577.1 MAG: MFS transporter [Bacteroidetes bacterium GWD2_33_33]HAN17423.1 MFS transporter [Bacteroidales bacterium]
MKKEKKALSFWQIWNMSFGFFGIQFGFALQNANVSRIFQTLDADVSKIALYWLAAPVTGLIVQPIIGHLSDNTWTRLGRRRPYFLLGALLASIALLIMPNSPALWIAVGMLWIMDASINISMEPFRAFVGDMLPSKQRTLGFSMQSFFIGTGAIIASFLPYVFTKWLNIANTAPEGEIPLSVRLSFYIGGAVFLASVLWTVFSTKEYTPEELAEFQDNEILKEQEAEQEKNIKNSKGDFKIGSIFFIAGLVITLILKYIQVDKEVYIFSLGLSLFGLLEIISGWLKKSGKTRNGFVAVISDFNTMPSTMKQLAIVQFFSWFALFAMWIYTTAGVTSHVYGTSDTTSAIYNDGANWVGICFGIYNGFAALFAFWLIYFAKITNRKITHSVSLIVGGISLASIYLITNPTLLLLPFVGIGLAWASILAMPYAMLTGSLPPQKMGVYMGIFNFFIVIPQILAASILGFIVKSAFNNHPVYALIIGGISMIIAGILVVFVKDRD